MNLKIFPRHSIYVASEKTADFIIDTEISYIHGEPWDRQYGSNNGGTVDFLIQGEGLMVYSYGYPNKTGNVVPVSLSSFTPRMEPYPITVTVSEGAVDYHATTNLFYLPEPKATTGSVVKIDNLYGSLLYRNPTTNGTFQRVFPYGFYGDYSGTFAKCEANVEDYVSKGFNVVNLVEDFSGANMTAVIDTMDRLNLFLQYDMRHSYRNLSAIAEQVPLVKDHPSLLTWYTADEPDGWQYDLDSTEKAHKAIAELDMYHPIALVLNCQNYHFREYTAGADIIMEDAYPVGINATYSVKWDTPCTDTLGDCGCDNCVGSLLDVPNRIDNYEQYNAWIGGAATRKPIWAVPQSFGSEDYWSRYPTAPEVWAMDLMALNHGARARLGWIYTVGDENATPETKKAQNETLEAAAALAKVVTKSPVADYLTSITLTLLKDGNTGGLDVGFWRGKTDGLLCIVNPTEKPIDPAEVELPSEIWTVKIASEPWGSVGWDLLGPKLVKKKGGLPGYATSCVIVTWPGGPKQGAPPADTL